MKYIYVNCENQSTFLEYAHENKQEEVEFVYIVNGDTLRGRTPGKIISIGDWQQRWNSQEIFESIDIHEQLWKSFLEDTIIQNTKDDNENILDYGIE